MWDTTTWEVREWRAHDAVQDVDVSRDGLLLVTASADWTARVWDAATGQLRSTLGDTDGNGHAGPVWSAAFDPSGTLIAPQGAMGA